MPIQVKHLMLLLEGRMKQRRRRGRRKAMIPKGKRPLKGRDSRILGAYQRRKEPLKESIPHICHFLYTGRIFKFKILHLKITKIYPKKSKICSFFAFNLEKFTPDRIFYTGSARGARDKYEVWASSSHTTQAPANTNRNKNKQTQTEIQIQSKDIRSRPTQRKTISWEVVLLRHVKIVEL